MVNEKLCKHHVLHQKRCFDRKEMLFCHIRETQYNIDLSGRVGGGPGTHAIESFGSVITKVTCMFTWRHNKQRRMTTSGYRFFF